MQSKEQMSQIKQLKLVPTSHNFGYVVNEFIRIKLNNESMDNFFHKKKYTINTIKAYCYPFQKKEFNLNNESLDSLKKLKEDSFDWLNKKHKLGFFVTDDKNYICLKNTWLVGHLNKNYPNISHSKKLVMSNFAGTNNASSAILTVGKSTGIYFTLLDMNGNPTKNFEKFYSKDMSLLENRF